MKCHVARKPPCTSTMHDASCGLFTEVPQLFVRADVTAPVWSNANCASEVALCFDAELGEAELPEPCDFEFADECSEEVLTELTESVVAGDMTDNLMPPSRSSAPTQEQIAVEMPPTLCKPSPLTDRPAPELLPHRSPNPPSPKFNPVPVPRAAPESDDASSFDGFPLAQSDANGIRN